jgi:hypothetical protein
MSTFGLRRQIEGNEQRTCNEAQRPVQVAGDERKTARQHDRLHGALRVGNRSQPIEQPKYNWRRNAGVCGDHGDRELHREGKQDPDAIAPGEHRLFHTDFRSEHRENQRGARENHTDHPRIGNPALGESREACTEIANDVEHGDSSSRSTIVKLQKRRCPTAASQ